MINFKSIIPIAVTTGLFISVAQITELLVLDKIVKLEIFLAVLVLLAFIAGLMIARFNAAEPGKQEVPPNIASLTAREMDIFLMLYNGKTNKEIAATYSIELSTVKT